MSERPIEGSKALELAANDLLQHLGDAKALGVCTSAAKPMIQREEQQQPEPPGPEYADLVHAAQTFIVTFLNELPELERVLIAQAIDRGRARAWVSLRPHEVAALLEWKDGTLQLLGRRITVTMH